MRPTATREKKASSLFARLYGRVARSYHKQIDGTGLAVFRIVFCAVQLGEILHLFYFRHLIFDVIPYVEPYEINLTTPLALWAFTTVLLMLGLFTRAAAVANYFFILLFLSTITSYEYHMFYTYQGIGALFVFLPIARCLSLDRLLFQLKYAGAGYQPARTVGQLAYFVPVFVVLAFSYFDSALHKLVSPMWLKGLGVWLPASLAAITSRNTTALLNQEGLIKLLGYLTLGFELLFIFLFPFRRLRLGLLIIGVGLHLGILLQFPIPFFALGFGSLYLLLVPVGCWRRLFSRQSAAGETAAPAARGPGPAAARGHLPLLLDLAGRRLIFLRRFSLPELKAAAAAAGIALLVILQLFTSYHSPLVERLRKQSGLDATAPGQALLRFTRACGYYAHTYLGITPHSVFLDFHFDGYTRLVAVTHTDAQGRETFLPITRATGQPGPYQSGPLWAKWGFRVVGPNPQQINIEEGIRDFTAFYAVHNGLTLNDCWFRVKVKRVPLTTDWQPDFLEKQMAAPWQDAGVVVWKKWKFTAQLRPISSF